MVYSTNILLYVFPCVILFLCFSVLLVLRLPRLGKRELILVLFVRLFGLCLFKFVGFLFLLGSGKGCGLWLWQPLDFSLTFFSFFLNTYDSIVVVLVMFVLLLLYGCSPLFFFFFFLFFFFSYFVLFVVEMFLMTYLASWSPRWGRGNWFIYFSLVCGLYTFCHSLFALPLGVITRLSSVIVALFGHFLYYFFLFGFYSPFKNISLISSRSFIKGGRKPENPGENHLTICKQNLAFPHVTERGSNQSG